MMTPHYRLTMAKERAPGTIVTQAFVLCLCCRKALDTVGGPAKALCPDCVTWLHDRRYEPYREPNL